MRCEGVKFDSKMLIPLAQQILASSENAIGADYVDPKDGKRVIDNINYSKTSLIAYRPETDFICNK